ncbi:MAG: methylated-DNA--[protein]-cysteine S-methyltransferase [Elusimicrobia bacterium]|nr:methylated-DNA--[protein]-cysteine S-methyltransferase [Elusimicrobiota bacterium]
MNVPSRSAVVVRACRKIQAAPTGEPPALKALAREAGLSPFHFHRLFTSALGVTPKQFAAASRMDSFKKRLRRGDSVTEALYAAGFNSSGRLYENSAEELGMPPKLWRDGAPGESIRFAAAPCALGALLVAATAKGACAIELGDDVASLVAGIRRRFSKADVRPDAALRGWLRKLLAFLERPGRSPALPLDIRGTAFQRRVWDELRRIPAGRTASYAEIAKRIGRPGASRAVARACGSNRLALAIPCHRVVGSDGALRGYRWGTERKRALLAREKR